MDRDDIGWRGYIPAVTTPFTEDGALDLDAWRELLDWLHRERMHGVAVAGTTGEWFSMTSAERTSLFQTAGEHIAGRMTMLAGCSAFTPDESIGYARAAQQNGFDGILLTLPPYVVLNDPRSDCLVSRGL
jgi:dihydrodipicolinate synthase/N-acetylneuraminate lyase